MTIIIIILLLITITYYLLYPKYLEGMINDEAAQNLASLAAQYDTDTHRVSNMAVANSISLGNKWKLSANGDAFANDTWLRIMKGDGSANYGGGVAANRLYSQTDIEATTNAKINGNLTAAGDASIANIHLSATTDSGGRMHISPSTDDLYLIPKQGGVIMGTQWGGNGNLAVQGNVNVSGSISSSSFKFFANPSSPYIFEYYIKNNGTHPLFRLNRNGRLVEITNSGGRVISSTVWQPACRGDRGNDMDSAGGWNWHSCGSDCGC